jgi:hypothetical protein
MTELVSLAQYKGYRNINGSTDDTKLNMLIPAISKLIRTYCGRDFTGYYTTSLVEYHTLKWFQNVVFLKELPIVEVVSVHELTEGSQTAYTLLTTDQYIVEPEMDAIYRIESEIRTNYPIGINVVKVTYKGGYAEVPADLQLAACDLITYYLKEQYLPEKNHASFTIRYNTDKPDFPDHIKRVLDYYKGV